MGDYYLPFLVTGLLPFLPSLIATIFIKSGTSKGSQRVSIFSLLKIPGFVLMSLAQIFCITSPIMIEPILSPHMEQFGLNLSTIGAAFVIQNVSFTIMTAISGKLVGMSRYKLPLLVLGEYPPSYIKQYLCNLGRKLYCRMPPTQGLQVTVA